MSYSYNYIESVLKVDDICYITQNNIFYHIILMFAVGLTILAMSKIIMNYVVGCANDCNVKIYCQDTGSIHLNYGDVDKTVKIYKHIN